MRQRRHPERSHPANPSRDTENDNEVQALAEAVLEAASVAGLGVSVSFDDGITLRHIYVNEAAAQILGRSVEELTGSATLLNFAPEERNRLLELARRSRQSDVTPGLAETIIVQPDGERVPAEVAFTVVTLSGEPAIVTFLRDIRERKAAEEALRRSEHRFRQLIEAAPDAIGVHRDQRLAYVNPAFAALWGVRSISSCSVTSASSYTSMTASSWPSTRATVLPNRAPSNIVSCMPMAGW